MARLDNNKWFVENVDKKTDIVVKAEPKHAVFISKIKDSVVTIQGKCNTVVIEASSGSGVIFDDVISTVEVINCKKLQVQANGAVPSVQVDKSSGVAVFLQTAAGQNADIVTSLSQEVNVTIPGATENDDSIEYAVPQQYVSRLVNGKLVTKPSEHV
eukprot:TRINITY_DN11422_c0_g1_i1.p1 TRINITY_DN11422_c0_g1~~TRINITY_DN11422_c0_g1_i1.p1  ORF type:complete len:157 (-),score=54.55 TRINITY_DN11422_c0_g1_i1:104-574(-)